MQKLLFSGLMLLSASLPAQVADAPMLRRVDSLLVVSRKLIGSSNYNQALEANVLAEQLALESFGPTSAIYGSVCGNHGKIMAYQGLNASAEQWYIQAKNIQETSPGPHHPDYAITLNDLGNLYTSMGRFELAEPLLLEAKSIWERALGPESEFAGWSAESLGSLYHQMNNYAKAEKYYEEAAKLRAKTLGKQHPYYATTLCSQASLCIQLGNYKKAEALYLEAKDIQEKTLGKLNAEYGYTLDGLAVLYDDHIKKPALAEALYLEVKTLREKILGPMHPDYGWSLGNLGNFYWFTGRYQEAEPLFLEAQAIWLKSYGKAHHTYLWSLHKLWALYWSMGNYDKAEPYWLELQQIEKKQLLHAAHYLSTDELSAYISKFQDGLDEGLSFANTQNHTAGACYDNVLFYKGFLLNAMAQLNRLALADTLNAVSFNELKSYEKRLAAAYSMPQDPNNPVEALEDKVNSLEKKLTRSISGLGEALRQVNWQEVQQALREDEAAIEFIHYKFVDPRPTDSICYAALLIRPGAKQPVFIPLFEEKQINALLGTAAASKPAYINALYGIAPKTGPSLYDLVWKPLEGALNGAKTIYFAPSGLLHRLHLGAIALPADAPGNTGTRRIHDQYRLVQLGSTRQLVVATEAKPGGAAPMLWGGIQYEIDSSMLSAEPPSEDLRPAKDSRGASFEAIDSSLRSGAWGYLKWTAVEVNATGMLLTDAGFAPLVRTGAEANEASFKAMGSSPTSPRILHIATHGFFFPDPTGREQMMAGDAQAHVFRTSSHPMIRSGLILAGGNYAWQYGKPFRPDMEDGILTAYEIGQLNLRNTELVVLSACETGLGDIQGNEGVYGLQRAFKIAGAKYLVMSLWQVPDFQTQELMTLFYAFWLEDNMSVPDAFRAAQKSMQEKYQEPFEWAGFVLVE